MKLSGFSSCSPGMKEDREPNGDPFSWPLPRFSCGGSGFPSGAMPMIFVSVGSFRKNGSTNSRPSSANTHPSGGFQEMGQGMLLAGPEEDLLTAITNAVASLGLRSNMQSLSTTTGRAGGNAVSVTMEGLSSEALAKFLQETERRGIFLSPPISVRSGTCPRPPVLRPAVLSAVLLLGRR